MPIGARGRSRTGTGSPPRDFKSLASTCSATRARGPPQGRRWRLGSESNRRTRLCRPLHDHSATQPKRPPDRGLRVETARAIPETRKPLCLPTRGPGVSLHANWSGKRDSNSRPQPWQGCALPTELFPPFTHSSREATPVKSGARHAATRHARRSPPDPRDPPRYFEARVNPSRTAIAAATMGREATATLRHHAIRGSTASTLIRAAPRPCRFLRKSSRASRSARRASSRCPPPACSRWRDRGTA